MKETIDFDQIDAIIDEIGGSPQNVITIFQRMRESCRSLPREALPYLAERMGISENEMDGAAAFYEQLSSEPTGKYIIRLCGGTACHIKKSRPVLDAVRRELGLSDEKMTTDDQLFSVQLVTCLGACGMAPALMVNDELYPEMTPAKAVALIYELRGRYDAIL